MIRSRSPKNYWKKPLLTGTWCLFVVTGMAQHSTDTPLYFTANLRATIHLLYIGGMLLMAIYHLLSFIVYRDRTYVFYSLYLLGGATFITYIWMQIDPTLKSYLFPKNPELGLWLSLTLIPSFVCYFLFFKYFLDTKRTLPYWNRLLKIAIWIALPATLLNVYYLVSQQDVHSIGTTNVAYVLMICLVAIPMMIPLFKSRNWRVYFFAFGFLVLMIGAICAAIAFIKSGRTGKFLYYYQTGSIIEVCCFSIGLAIRARSVEREKQKAKVALIRTKVAREQEQAERERLSELNRAKTNFYANITHEFRTPLTVILGITDQLQANEAERAIIRRNGKDLLHLVNRLLELAKHESGASEPDYRQGDIVSYTRYLSESFHSLMQEKNLQFTFHTEIDQLVMDYDAEKFQQIIYNLLANAIKFTPRGGKIILHIQRHYTSDGVSLKIKVKDTGIGIAAADVAHIFDQFYSLERSTDRTYAGSGIGLALSKDWAEIMGGRLTVDSELNQGSTFTLTLPVRNESALMNNEEFETPDDIGEPPRSFHAIEEETKDGNMYVPSEEAKHILVVEDHADVRFYIQKLLRNEYQISTASNGSEALTLALRTIPDLVISDVMMPGMNGYQLCAQLKADHRTSHVPVILLTAKNTQSAREVGIQHGADAYLVKPFHQKEFRLRIQHLIALRQQMQSYYQRMNPTDWTTISALDVAFTPPAKEHELILRLKKAVLDNLDDAAFGSAELSRVAAMSRSQIYRKLKAVTGKTPTQFVRSIRLNVARKMLTETDQNVSEIAYQVGFKDPGYFSRVYRQEFGYQPREERGG